jgi:hypothetical protein
MDAAHCLVGAWKRAAGLVVSPINYRGVIVHPAARMPEEKEILMA